MFVYIVNNDIERRSQKTGAGLYIGTDDNWSEDKIRWPKINGNNVIVDTAAKTAYETAQFNSAKESAKTRIYKQFEEYLENTKTANGYPMNRLARERASYQWNIPQGHALKILQAEVDEILSSVTVAFARYETKTTAIESATTIQQLQGIDY